MAITHNNLWPDAVSWQNLLLAYRRCRRRKRYKRGALEFDAAWESNLLELKRDLAEATYRPGPYRHFYVFEPKRRKISAAPFRDRIVHHAVVNVLEPLFERRFIYDSYACRRGKGTHAAVDRAQHYLRRFPFYLKTDIVKFFPSVDHAVLLDLLTKRIADQRLMDLIRVIVASGEGVLADETTGAFFPGDDLFSLLRPKGLPIGNLTSQFFANVLLDQADHFVKEQLHVPGYVRYADDFVLFGESKAALRIARWRLEERLAPLRLKLHASKTQIRPSSQGLAFLGMKLWPGSRRLQCSTVLRFSRRLRSQRKAFAEGRLTSVEIRRSFAAFRAHAGHANASALLRILSSRAKFTRRRG